MFLQFMIWIYNEEWAAPRSQDTPARAKRLMVDITAAYRTVVWAPSLYMQDTLVNRERTTGTRVWL